MLFTKFHYFKQNFEPVLLSIHVHGYYFSIHISRSVISRCILMVWGKKMNRINKINLLSFNKFYMKCHMLCYVHCTLISRYAVLLILLSHIANLALEMLYPFILP